MNKIRNWGAATLATLSAPMVFAATDTAAITAAGTDGLAIAAAVMGVLVSIWAAKLVYRKFFGG